MLTPTKKIWHNGRFIRWDDAQIHVLSHVVSYGSSVFEGIRCYATANGAAVFRLHEDVRRIAECAKELRIDLPFTHEELTQHTKLRGTGKRASFHGIDTARVDIVCLDLRVS